MLQTSDVPEGDPSFQAGWKILSRALQRPLEVLAKNAGYRSEYTAEKLLDFFSQTGEYWTGWDANTGGLRNLLEGDLVVDPQEVAMSVIETCVSASGTLLTVEASLSHE